MKGLLVVLIKMYEVVNKLGEYLIILMDILMDWNLVDYYLVGVVNLKLVVKKVKMFSDDDVLYVWEVVYVEKYIINNLMFM